ncbi:MAG: methionyl-tRNA formyltransferase [Bacteroidales bacterium]
MKNLRIVFMGTPEFAVATLGALLMNGFNVVGVVTTPDKPAGRGRKISKSSVKEFASFSYLPVFQPENLEDPAFIEEMKKLKPDLIIVVAFRKLPEVIWKLPPMGTINLHASLLPHYRGAAPINHVIIDGETKTGLTTFFINDKIDTGNILLQEEVQIYPHENAGDLKARLMKLGARLIIKTLEGLVKNTITPFPQSQLLKPGEIPRTAPKILPADCIIDWSNDCTSIHNLVRGLAPDPCARSFFRGKEGNLLFKIYESHPDDEDHLLQPGEIVTDGKQYLKIACGRGYLSVRSIQLEGKKKMSINDFLRGFRIKNYSISANKPV